MEVDRPTILAIVGELYVKQRLQDDQLLQLRSALRRAEERVAAFETQTPQQEDSQ